MAKQVNKKKKNQSVSSIIKKINLKSTLSLYFVFIVVLIDILCLWASRDNESIFLFIILAFIIYMQEKNMIVVLGVPFVIVNVLIVLRNLFRKTKHEGFEDQFKDFAVNYIKEKESDINDFNNEDISGHGSLYDMTRFIVEENKSKQDYEKLYEFLENVSNNESLDREDTQVKFVEKMFLEYLKTLRTEKKVNENENFLEDDENEKEKDNTEEKMNTN